MDLVRLALERAATADEALDQLTALLEAARPGRERRAGPRRAVLLLVPHRRRRPAGGSSRPAAAPGPRKPVGAGAAISNRISLGTDWTRASADVAPGARLPGLARPEGADRDRRPPARRDERVRARRDRRRAATDVRAARARRDAAHHGDRPWGAPGSDPRRAARRCRPASTRTGTASPSACTCATTRQRPRRWSPSCPPIRTRRMRAWVALGSPCASVYVPVFPPLGVPAELGERRRRGRGSPRCATGSRPTRTRSPTVRARLAGVEAELWERADAAVATSRSRRARRVPRDGLGAGRRRAPSARRLTRPAD